MASSDGGGQLDGFEIFVEAPVSSKDEDITGATANTRTGRSRSRSSSSSKGNAIGSPSTTRERAKRLVPGANQPEDQGNSGVMTASRRRALDMKGNAQSGRPIASVSTVAATVTPGLRDGRKLSKQNEVLSAAATVRHAESGVCSHTPTPAPTSSSANGEDCSLEWTDSSQVPAGVVEPVTEMPRRRSPRFAKEGDEVKTGHLDGEDEATHSEPAGSNTEPGSPVVRRSTRIQYIQQNKAFKHKLLMGLITTDATEMLRRSSRLGYLQQKKTEAASSTQSVLGKRTRETVKKEDERSVKRRIGLRSRNSSSVSSAAKDEEKSMQKRKEQRKSASVKSKEKQSAEKSDTPTSSATESSHAESVISVPQKKIWLNHGLFAEQDPNSICRVEDILKRLKSRRRRSTRRSSVLLPLPLNDGAKLIETGRDFKLPFDVFSPLPPGQPKPVEWRTINKNVFIDEAAKLLRNCKAHDCSPCMCTIESGCGHRCQNRTMLYECNSNNCLLGPEHCKNRGFEELRRRTKGGNKYDIGVDVFKTEDRGYGVRSNRTFEPNQIIVEYTGEVITQDECERRMRSIYKKNQCYYFMHLDRNMVIDATRGSIARFVNHSCEPNCKMEKWTVANKPRMALFAGSNGIMTGEELTYDYNFNPYSRKNAQICKCGAPTCRGVLGPRPPRDAPRKAPESDSRQPTQKNVRSARRSRKVRKPETTRKTATATKKRDARVRSTSRTATSSSTSLARSRTTPSSALRRPARSILQSSKDRRAGPSVKKPINSQPLGKLSAPDTALKTRNTRVSRQAASRARTKAIPPAKGTRRSRRISDMTS